MLPGVGYFLLFHYGALAGNVIAFKEYVPFEGLAGSPWIGLGNFQRLFADGAFWSAVLNTLAIALLRAARVTPRPSRSRSATASQWARVQPVTGERSRSGGGRWEVGEPGDYLYTFADIRRARIRTAPSAGRPSPPRASPSTGCPARPATPGRGRTAWGHRIETISVVRGPWLLFQGIVFR
ncbi:hypothetical protein ACIPSA_30340 [Streptomyces sp. NPDC086549]|uniref:hypothetical protein n=1 Tax=Streptomyces sp. NPDC086549 TaxID=3365752 RepID=UPI00382DB212